MTARELLTSLRMIRPIAAVMLATALLGAAVEATKIHKLYEDAGSFFWSQLNKQVITDATHIYVLLDNDDGMLLTKTDMSGNIVWSHLYGDGDINASTLTIGSSGNVVLVSQYTEYRDVVVTKINPVSGNVIWSKRYPGMDEAFTINERGSTFVLMGNTSYVANVSKPIAMAINDTNGNVVWAKLYLEADAGYTTDYIHRLQAAATNPGTITYVGKFYDSVLSDTERARMSMITIDAGTGEVSGGTMQAFDLTWSGGEVESDSPYTWDIARVNGANDQPDGFAISGTIVHTPSSSDPAVLRVSQAGVPLWGKVYRSANSNEGIGRGVRQNKFFNNGRLDVYSSWDFYRHAIDVTGTVSGLMHINESDGSPVSISIYDVPGADYQGLSMNPDGTGGYLALGAKADSPYTSFQLLKVGQVGGGVEAYVEHPLTAEDLEIEEELVEMVSADDDITPIDHPLTWVDLPLIVTDVTN
jgi:hypothetical protein